MIKNVVSRALCGGRLGVIEFPARVTLSSIVPKLPLYLHHLCVMADVRALLKAKRQEARVNHPLASYTTNGQLRCIACGTIVKHASSWEGHVGSKTHRMNAVKLREEEQRRAARAEEEAAKTKRKADDSSPEPDLPTVESKRRRMYIEASKAQAAPKRTNEFPADFFSNPVQVPPPPDSDEEGAEEGADNNAAVSSAPAPSSTIDSEWEKFQQAVLNPPDEHDAYERATVFAEPVPASDVPEGFPLQQGDGPAANDEDELTEEQKRQRKEQEERELIMDRLMEEERAQEEADAKVAMLKNRLEALRKQREAKKAARSK